MQEIATILHHKGPKVAMKRGEWVLFSGAIRTYNTILLSDTDVSIYNIFESRLTITVFSKLAERIQDKTVYFEQENVSFRFKHDEAFAFIVLAGELIKLLPAPTNTLVQTVFNTLHQHYA